MGALVVIAGGTALAGHFGLHVELSPDGETKPVYSEHTVTAEVSNSFVSSAGATVVFEISGPDGTFWYTTQADENSQATLTFDNSGLAGTYTMSAAAELQSSGWGSLTGESSEDVTVTFTGGAPPTIVESGLSPQKGATGVARDANVMAPFSEIIKEETISSSTFKLFQRTIRSASDNGSPPTRPTR